MRILFGAAAAACLLFSAIAIAVAKPFRAAAAIAFASAVTLIILLMPSLAFAADGSVASYAIDFTPVVTFILSIVGTVLAALATAWLNKALKSVGLSLDSQQRDAIEHGAESVANMLIGKIRDGSLKITTKSQAIGEFASLLLQHYPDALHYFGLDDDGVKLANLIEARLEKWGVMPVIEAANAKVAPAAAAKAPASAVAAAAAG